MTTNDFEIEDDIKANLQDSMKSGEGVELPFPAMYFWALNGNPALKQIGGTQYYGGWASKAEQIIEACERMDIEMPAALTASEISTKNNDAYEAYVIRSLIVAPVAFRSRWIAKDGKMTSPEYAEGYRRHVQVLGLMGQYDKEAKAVLMIAPVVLTGKGYQAANLLATLKEFEKHIDGQRRRDAPQIPPHCFWRKVGTFGEKPNVKMVGPEKSQSPITPICVELPEKLDIEKLKLFYVGKDGASQMSYLLSEAREWLSAWKTTPAKTQAPADEWAHAVTDAPVEEEF